MKMTVEERKSGFFIMMISLFHTFFVFQLAFSRSLSTFKVC